MRKMAVMNRTACVSVDLQTPPSCFIRLSHDNDTQARGKREEHGCVNKGEGRREI